MSDTIKYVEYFFERKLLLKMQHTSKAKLLLDLNAVSYIHLTGHYFDVTVKMPIDSHGTKVNSDT